MNTDSKENLRVKIEELRHSLNEKVENNLQTKLSNESSLSENSVEKINSSEKCCSENSDNTNNEKGCCHKTKERTTDEQKKLMNRLSRIEGQIRGIKGMVEKDAYCTDILVQVSAVTSALNSFSRELLANHIRTCVVHDIKADKEETVDDLISTLKKILK